MTEREDSYIAGTRIGGLKAKAKNLAKEPKFYQRIGAKGGANGTTGGFAGNRELARIAGAKGGRISRRRGPVKVIKATAADIYGHGNDMWPTL